MKESRFLQVVKFCTLLLKNEVIPMNMLLEPDLEYNKQDYTRENCISCNIPFIKNFVDIDSRLNNYGELRVQGYASFTSIEDLLDKYNEEELGILIKWLEERSYNNKICFANNTYYITIFVGT